MGRHLCFCNYRQGFQVAGPTFPLVRIQTAKKTLLKSRVNHRLQICWVILIADMLNVDLCIYKS